MKQTTPKRADERQRCGMRDQVKRIVAYVGGSDDFRMSPVLTVGPNRWSCQARENVTCVAVVWKAKATLLNPVRSRADRRSADTPREC